MLTKEGLNIDFKNMRLADMAEGNAVDSYYTLKLFNKLNSQINSFSPVFHKFYEEVIKPLTIEFSTITFNGIPISKTTLSKVDKEIRKRVAELEDKIYLENDLPSDFNLNSSKHLISKLYLCKSNDVINLKEGSYNLFWPDVTDSGEPKTDNDALSFILKAIIEELGRRG